MTEYVVEITATHVWRGEADSAEDAKEKALESAPWDSPIVDVEAVVVSE